MSERAGVRRPKWVGPWRIWQRVERREDGELVLVDAHWGREFVEEDGHEDCCRHTDFVQGPSL